MARLGVVGRGWVGRKAVNTAPNQPAQPAQPNNHKGGSSGGNGKLAHAFLGPGRLVWLATLGNAHTVQDLRVAYVG